MAADPFLTAEGAVNRLLEELGEIQSASQQLASAKDSTSAIVGASGRIVEAANGLLTATAGMNGEIQQLELPGRLQRLQDALDGLTGQVTRLEEMTQRRFRLALVGVGLALILAVASVALLLVRP